LLGRGSTTCATPPFFVLYIFKIGLPKLFSQAGFEPRPSWSLPPKQLGLQVWTTGTCLFFLNEGGTWTQGFTLAKQAFYFLSHTSSPFRSDYFDDRILQTICRGSPWTIWSLSANLIPVYSFC
jgi:hypothetical protein